jgi:anti-sigma factor RsiW
MNGTHEHLTPEDEADLAALADGALYGPRRAAIEARLRVDPALAAALERQRAAVSLLAVTALPAPLSLRLRVEELQRAPVRRRRRLPALALAFAASLAAVLVLVLGSGPVVDDVLAVALRPATAPAVAGEQFEGIRFPRYEQWRMTGARTDVVGGRTVRTVFYARDGREIAYAIVSGPALSDDGSLRVVRDGSLAAVTWTRDGRTCVIVGRGDPGVLARLAVW